MKTTQTFFVLCVALAIGVAAAVALMDHLTTDTFTPRIIQNRDGTYTCEYYYPRDKYKVDQRAHRVTLEEARQAAEKWRSIADGDISSPKIVE